MLDILTIEIIRSLTFQANMNQLYRILEFYGLQDFHSDFEPPTSELSIADVWVPVPNHLLKHLIVAVNLHSLQVILW